RLGQLPGTGSTEVFPVIEIAPRKRPVDVLDASPTRVHPQDRAGALRGRQLQPPLGGLDQLRQGRKQLAVARIEAIEHDLAVTGGGDPPQLPSPSALVTVEETFGRSLGFLPALQPR